MDHFPFLLQPLSGCYVRQLNRWVVVAYNLNATFNVYNLNPSECILDNTDVFMVDGPVDQHDADNHIREYAEEHEIFIDEDYWN